MTIGKYRITHLAGRARSGGDSVGKVTHLVESFYWKALCGKEPGRRSAGWSEYNDNELTCPRCITKLQKMTQEA